MQVTPHMLLIVCPLIFLAGFVDSIGVAGHFIGSSMVVKNGSRIVRPIILFVLTILFLKALLGL